MTRTHYSILLAAVLMLTVCLLLLRRPAELPPLAVPASVPSPARITVETPPASQPMDYESIRTRTAEALPQVLRPQESLPPEPSPTVAQNPPVIAPEAPQNVETSKEPYYSASGALIDPTHAINIPPDQWTPRQRAYMEQNAALNREHYAEQYRRKQFEKQFFDNLEKAAIQREHDKQMRRHALGGGF